MGPKATPPRRSITESPWYWAYLFCTGGLVALVIVGPKYAQRQTQIEQNGQKRQWAAQLAAGREQTESPTSGGSQSIALWPLFVVLGTLLSLAWLKLIYDHRRRQQVAGEATAAGDHAAPPAPSKASDPLPSGAAHATDADPAVARGNP